jgi:ketosteroid isomerase-like protein
MCNLNEWIVRQAFLAYDRGDISRMLELMDPGFEWIYLEPGQEGSPSRVCHGRKELEIALRRQVDHGLRAEVEEVLASGDQVILVMHTPGIDKYLHRQADDRTYDVVTVRNGLIVRLHACRDRSEARSLAGIS